MIQTVCDNDVLPHVLPVLYLDQFFADFRIYVAVLPSDFLPCLFLVFRYIALRSSAHSFIPLSLPIYQLDQK